MTKPPDQRAILFVFIDWPRDSEIKDQTKGDRLLWLNQPPDRFYVFWPYLFLLPMRGRKQVVSLDPPFSPERPNVGFQGGSGYCGVQSRYQKFANHYSFE
jgi:hypothetical protein